MGNIVDVSVDVSVLFLATAIAEMKMDELSGVSRFLSNFIVGGWGMGREGEKSFEMAFIFVFFKRFK